MTPERIAEVLAERRADVEALRCLPVEDHGLIIDICAQMVAADDALAEVVARHVRASHEPHLCGGCAFDYPCPDRLDALRGLSIGDET